jgi:hypothetical protein
MPASASLGIEPDARRAEIRPPGGAAGPIIHEKLGQDVRSIGLEPFPCVLACQHAPQASQESITGNRPGVSLIDAPRKSLVPDRINR